MATRLLTGCRYDRHSRPAPLPGSDSQHEAGRNAYPLVVVSPGHGMQPGVRVIEVGNADCESVVQFDVQPAAGGDRTAGAVIVLGAQVGHALAGCAKAPSSRRFV